MTKVTKKKTAKKATKKSSSRKTAKKGAAKKTAKKSTARRVTAKKSTKKSPSKTAARSAAKKATKKKSRAAAPKKVKSTPVMRISSVQAPKVKTGRHSKSDLNFYRDRLLEKRTDITNLYRAELKHGQITDEDGGEDIVDRANNAYSRELSVSISESERQLLIEIDEAIKRLENGEFGVCQNSGVQIPKERLRAVPWARYCIECQELHEKGLLD